ncbi:MAG: hypothetical protein JO330_12495 [Mycobacteriaceae bacterium]|nr:hypothetical protein [Mycobacteriaceae bacterium]
MGPEPFIGSEAVAAGQLTPYALRSRFKAIYPDVYIAADAELTSPTKAHAAWLWSDRRGVLAGFSASALHRAKWIDAHKPAEILHPNRHPPRGVKTYLDRFAADEVQFIRGMRVTTPARTAFDLACRHPTESAVAAIDSLARATHLQPADVERIARRYPGRRGIKRARASLELVDPGAESPRETGLRLLLIRANFPRPQTQIPVYDDFGHLIARLDMGWQDLRVAVEYEGDHHRSDPRQFTNDIRRVETLTELGWIIVRVTAQDTPAGIIRRVAAARARPTAWSA